MLADAEELVAVGLDGVVACRGSRSSRANFALVEWPDNATIGAEPPSVYFPRYAHRLGPEDRYWHALPDGWHEMPYGEFLEARRKLIARVIRDGFARLGSAG